MGSQPDLRAVLNRLTSRWYVFLGSLAVGLLLAWLANRYAQRVYYTQATMIVRDDKDDRRLLENLVEGLNDGYGNATRNLDNEAAVLTSSALMRETVDSLHLLATVFAEGQVRGAELYRKGPLIVRTDSVYTRYAGRRLLFERDGLHGYRLWMDDEKTRLLSPVSGTFVSVVEGTPPPMLFGRSYRLEGGDFSCYWDKGREKELNNGARLYVAFNDPTTLVDEFRSILRAGPTGQGKATMLLVACQGPVVAKLVDFCNQHSRNYIRRGLAEKNQMAERTLSFIDGQIREITSGLRAAEGELKDFRTRNRVMDLSASSQAAFTKVEDLQSERARLLVSRKYYDYLLGYVQRNGSTDQMVAPSTLGIEDPLLNSLIGRLSQLYAEKNSLQLSARERNPALVFLDERISTARRELEENVRNIIRGSDISLGDLDQRLGQTEQQILRLPETERAFVNLQRRFSLNDNIYTYLMQKRAEAGMARAANATDVRLLEPATVRATFQVAPKPLLLYALAISLGLILPAVVLAGMEYFNDRIRSRAQLEQLVQIPVLGSIGHAPPPAGLVASRRLRSVITESFRSIRLNLNYITEAGSGPDLGGARLVAVTSSVSGEGKTFTSLNLAAVSALAGKRTLLIFADLRKPRQEPDLEISLTKGLSDYLIGQADMSQIVQGTQVENLYAIAPGPLPPNPAELTGSPRMAELLKEARNKFDFIIIDTPPIGLVSDFLQVAPLADVSIYLVRHNYTRRGFLSELNALYEEGKLGKAGIVINDVAEKAGPGYGYNYGYGYGYNYEGTYFDDQQKPSLLRRLGRKTKSLFGRT